MIEVFFLIGFMLLGMLAGSQQIKTFDSESGQIIESAQSTADDKCKYYLKDSQIAVKDKCGKYNVGDKLSVIKSK